MRQRISNSSLSVLLKSGYSIALKLIRWYWPTENKQNGKSVTQTKTHFSKWCGGVYIPSPIYMWLEYMKTNIETNIVL